MENVELEFTDEALRAVVEKAKERKTGARGLRAITEDVMLDIMYVLPEIENLQKCVIDENTINTKAEPQYILNA